MYSQRSIEERLAKVSKMFYVVLVTGPRQVGKSTLLKYNFPNINYITFDDPLLLSTANQEPGLFSEIMKLRLLLMQFNMRKIFSLTLK